MDRLFEKGAAMTPSPHMHIEDSLASVMRPFVLMRPRWERIKPAWFPILVVLLVLLFLGMTGARDIVIDSATTTGRGWSLLLGAALLGVAIWCSASRTLHSEVATKRERELIGESADSAPALGKSEIEAFREAYTRPIAQSRTRLQEWLPPWLGAMPLMSVAFIFAVHGLSYSEEAMKSSLMAVVSLICGFFLLRFFTFMDRINLRTRSVHIQIHFISLAMSLKDFLILAYMSIPIFVVIGVYYLEPFWITNTLGPTAVTFVFISSVVLLASYTVMSIDHFYRPFPPFTPVVAFGFLTWFFLQDSGGTPIRHLESAPQIGASPAPLGEQRQSGYRFETWAENRPNTADHFRRWLDERGQALASATVDHPFPVFIVAAEGGGIRAAYWAAAVLSLLEDEHPEFFCHVFALSTVSGGSLGGAVYDAALAAMVDSRSPSSCASAWYSAARAPRPVERLAPLARDMLSADFLTPAIAGLLISEALGQVFPVGPDRIGGLERAWERTWQETLPPSSKNPFAEPFGSLWEGELSTLVPALAVNATDAATGKPVVLSPLLTVRHGAAGYPIDGFAGPVQTAVALSTVVGISARFPYISPPALADDGSLLVDGGYFDNSGVWTATLLRQLIEAEVARRQRSGQHVRVVLLRLVNSTVESIDETIQRRGETASVLRTLLSVRQRLMDQFATEARLTFGEENVVALELPKPADPLRCVHEEEARLAGNTLPLSWVLQRGAADLIDQKARDALCKAGLNDGWLSRYAKSET